MTALSAEQRNERKSVYDKFGKLDSSQKGNKQSSFTTVGQRDAFVQNDEEFLVSTRSRD